MTLAHQGAIAYGDSFVSVRPRPRRAAPPDFIRRKGSVTEALFDTFNSRSRIAKRIAFLFVLKPTLLSRIVDLFEGTEPARIGALGTAVAIRRKGRKKN